MAENGNGRAAFAGFPVVAIHPCSETSVNHEGLCFSVITNKEMYSLPVEKIKGFRFVPDGKEM